MQAHANGRCAVLMYVIDGYDTVTMDGMMLPEDLEGFLLTTEEDLPTLPIEYLTRCGWKVQTVNRSDSTEYISAPRLTSKRIKWTPPSFLNVFDLVLTHDANVRVDYKKVHRFLSEHMASSDDALFKQNADASIYTEIDGFLNESPDRIRTSRQNVERWRQHLVDTSYPDIDYIETDIFVFRPQSDRYRTFGAAVYLQCHDIQRDQFLVPPALLAYGVQYKVLPQRTFEKMLGYRRVPVRQKIN